MSTFPVYVPISREEYKRILTSANFRKALSVSPEEDGFVPPRELWIGPDDPISHYYRWVWEYHAYLTLLCDLRRHSTVLELGCGHGRLARGLLGYLWHPGRYVGLDVDRRRLTDAQERIQRRFSSFEFIWADVYNRHYNSGGAVAASDYRFPFEDSTFDVVFAGSLFTHLLPEETAQYFRETRRVLKPGGRVLFSFFLLDNYRGPGTTVSSQYEFPHPLPGNVAAVRDAQFPDAVVGYRVVHLTALAEQAGLELQRVIPGWWSNKADWAVNEQDLLVLTRER